MSKTYPVFLVGSYRSGTNMTVWTLDRSSEVTLYNEDNPKAFGNFYLKDKQTIEALVQETEAPIALFKPISDTWQVRQFLSDYSNSKVLFIFRRVEDMIRSFIKEFGEGGRHTIQEVNLKRMVERCHPYFQAYPERYTSRTYEYISKFYSDNLDYNSLIALFWLLQNRLYLDLELQNEPRVRLLNYEALVENPKDGFVGICEFLGIPFYDELIRDVKKTGRWNFEVPINPIIQEECNHLFEQLIQFI